MKVVRAKLLDAADRRRFSELQPKIDADALRQMEYDALVFNSAYVRQTWRKQKKKK